MAMSYLHGLTNYRTDLFCWKLELHAGSVFAPLSVFPETTLGVRLLAILNVRPSARRKYEVAYDKYDVVFYFGFDELGRREHTNHFRVQSAETRSHHRWKLTRRWLLRTFTVFGRALPPPHGSYSSRSKAGAVHIVALIAIAVEIAVATDICEIKMKLRVVWRKVRDYIRYDLKEIAFPSSLPDPPHIKKRRKLTWLERYYVLKEASRLYAASWVRDIGPELRPNDYKKGEESEDKPGRARSTTKEKEPSTLEDLAVAARGGMETLRPALQRVYMTRASAYRDALKSFIEGYQEGIQQTIEKKEDFDSPQKDKTPPKPHVNEGCSESRK